MFGSGNTTLIISNKEMNDIMRILKPHEKSGLLMKRVIKTIKNKAKVQKEGNVLGTVSASLLTTFLTGKEAIAMSRERGINREGEVTFRASEVTVRAVRIFIATSFFKYKYIIKTNLNLTVFFQEISYLK